jgi:excisionase family DNA binding protein
VTAKLFGIEPAAEMLSISVPTMRFWIHKGTAPAHVKIGKRLYWREADIDAWIDEQFNAQAGA